MHYCGGSQVHGERRKMQIVFEAHFHFMASEHEAKRCKIRLQRRRSRCFLVREWAFMAMAKITNYNYET